MSIDPFVFSVAALTVLLISFLRGAFGGGFAVLGIPVLALVMDPLQAGALLAPLFPIVDIAAFRAWPPKTSSKPDLRVLLPGLVVGLGAGWLILRDVDPHLVQGLIGAVTVGFVALWATGGAQAASRPLSAPAALAAGFGSGVTSMVAHAGGPPLALYLLRRGLSKETYAGTNSMFFTVGNLLKAGPWLIVVPPTAATWTMVVLCLPMVGLGVWAGWAMHQRLNQAVLFRICYGLLALTGLRLLVQAFSG